MVGTGSSTQQNLLSHDGEVFYHESFLPNLDGNDYLRRIRSDFQWDRDEVMMFGRRILVPREVVWVADEGISYTYSGVKKLPQEWSEALSEVKSAVEAKMQTTFNSCLLNYYADGSQGMGWHQDNEPSIERRSPIASVSFGAERKFSFKHKLTKETLSLQLASGSLLIMGGKTQENWAHQLPKSKRTMGPRLNLTFRKMVTSEG